MPSNYTEKKLKKKPKSLEANNFLHYENWSDVNQEGFTNVIATWTPYTTTLTGEFLTLTFLAKLLVPPTIAKR